MSHISLYFFLLCAISGSVVFVFCLFFSFSFLSTHCPYFLLLLGKPMAESTAQGWITVFLPHTYPSPGNISQVPPISCLIDRSTTSGMELVGAIPQSFISCSWLSLLKHLSTFPEDVLTGTLSADISKAGKTD